MEFTSTRVLKKDVLNRYRGNWITAIKANFLPIISAVFTSFFTMSIAGVTAFLMNHVDSSQVNQAVANTPAGTNTSGSSVAMDFFFNAVVLFFAVGIQYGLLDWLRNQDQKPSWGAPFQTFTKKYFVSTLAMYIFQSIFRFFWTFLLVIPGWIKYYSYSQSYLIYKDAVERNREDSFEFVNFITFSRRLMDGHKARLFLLQFSLIGWYILSFATFGIGFIWLIPYKNGLYAAFYNDLVEKNGRQVLPEIFA
jgi:uncharacterized membrane protein